MVAGKPEKIKSKPGKEPVKPKTNGKEGETETAEIERHWMFVY